VNDDINFSELGPTFVSEDADLLEAGPSFEPYAGVEVNPAERGYTVVYNYALYFWRPFLGNTAFALWELMLSFCYGDCDTAYPSISRLARMLTNSDHSRAVVTGRRRTERAANGDVPSEGRYLGALGVLRRERLVQVMRRGHGPTTRYTFRVLKSLPLLRPEQVARLSPSLQRDHAAWLERYGIDLQTYRQAFERGSSPSGSRTTVPGCTPLDPDLTPADGDNSGDALGNRGAAHRSTNNTQEKDLMKNWWQEALSELRLQLTRSMFDTTLLPTEACSFQDGVLTIRAPTTLVCERLQHRLGLLIRRTLVAVSEGEVQQVRFIARRSSDGTSGALG
jgi:hypothetical protein